MATLNTRDPVQGLIDYVQDVKPYHTKILEVWVEYIYGDKIEATIKDEMKMEIDILFDRARKYCDYGWDMTVWGKMLADLEIEEIVPGTIQYATGKTVKKTEAYQLYYNYLCDVWRWNNGEGPQPTITTVPTSTYYLLSFAVVMDAAKGYFANISNHFQYWYEPSQRKLYKKVGNEWHEQSAFISLLEPTDAVDMDVWVNTLNMTLYVYLSGSWQENTNFYVSYKAPKNAPRYPPEWNSVWDRPECNPPWGENWVYAYVTDELTFEHGNELFLSESIRTMVFDPTGEPQNQSGTTARTEYPIKFRTVITQDSNGRYNITREEVSIITEPNNPEIKNHPYAISLDGNEFEGFGLDRNRRGVRLTEFLVWRFKDDNEGMQLIADSVFNRDTFGLKVQNNHLVAQSITGGGRVDIDCPFNDGQIVYFTSSDDLPTYSLLTQDYRRPLSLMRYQPYKIKKISAREFSVQLVKVKPQFDAVTGDRIAPRNPTYDIDTEMMGSSPYLHFLTYGHGDMFFGLGHPVPFLEVRQHSDDTAQTRIMDGIYSTTEAFPGYRYSQIRDVLIGFNDHGTTRNAFVLDGDYTKLAKGEIIKVIGSSGSKNDGDWVITKATLWTNVQLDATGVPVRDVTGRMIQLPVPAWWNEMFMFDWPQANLLGAEYYSVTTIGIAGTAPSTQYPFGNVAFRYYNFGEPRVSQNIAQTQITDTLFFGSQVLTQKPDGSWEMVPELGTPGASIVFKDAINVSIQEQLAPNGYGIPTIGSFDIHYYDIASYDDGVSRE